ncbi:MAG: hypothetical protein LQ352_004492 [Teloschistes flavicans]|nr:MAG: hypothetical protein LQ352_004492 [Teloschistes flavicans]
MSESESKLSTPTQDTEAHPSRTALLGQASRFLKQDEIKNASTEKKIDFLQSKGLTDGETHRLLGLSSKAANANAEKEEESIELSSSPSSLHPSQSETGTDQSSSQPPPAKDIPPIITYPEFLIHSRKPPPLITASRLISTFYLFSGAAAAVYGTSKYIAEPMLEALTSARHSLSETAKTNLDTLNEHLEKSVSIIPNGVGAAKQDDDDENNDTSGTSEDIAPLFNRTIGTQTSPPHSPSSFISSSTTSPAPKQQDTLFSQQSSLHSLHTALASLLPPTDATKLIKQQDSTSSALTDLNQYLETLRYSRFYKPEPKDDAIAKFRAEIRGVKGVLLSARNFPAGPGRGGTIGGTQYDR